MMFTDNGPDYRCPKCEQDILGEIGHECSENVEEEKEENMAPLAKNRGGGDLTAIDVILNGIRSTLEPDGIDKEEVKILKEKDERRK